VGSEWRGIDPLWIEKASDRYDLAKARNSSSLQSRIHARWTVAVMFPNTPTPNVNVAGFG